jgi:hypothetical protein
MFSTPSKLLGLAMAATVMFHVQSAAAQAPLPTPMPPTPETPAAPPAPPLPGDPSPMPMLVAPPAPAQPIVASGTDHESVIGRWGLEARRVVSLNRTLGQENGCVSDCPVDLNALSLRKWTTADYAYSFGLALAVGGGSSRLTPTESAKTWDTYLGFGPTMAASFLLTSWKHLAVSFTPGLDVVFFMPSSKGSKSLVVDLRGVVEGELHLGMIGLPQASVALSAGLEAGMLFATKDNKPMAVPVANATATKWAIGFSGPQSLWDLVTRAQLRYFF